MHHHQRDYGDFYHQQMIQAAAMCRIPEPHPALASAYPTLIPADRISCEVSLLNADLWKQFHEIGTEMIITKGGRRMFPSLRVSMNGLDPRERYCVLLELALESRRRLRWAGGSWSPAGGAEPQSSRRLTMHPDSPATGEHWNSNVVSFGKVKLTNNAMDTQGHMILTSMHKYIPKIIIVKESDLAALSWSPAITSFSFPETEFVAVTAYQSDKITKLKIENNPFAKGFRECGQSRCKRKKHTQHKEEDEEEERAKIAEVQEDDSADEPPCKRSTTSSDSTTADDASSASSLSPRLVSPSVSPPNAPWYPPSPYARMPYLPYLPEFYGAYWPGRFLPLCPPPQHLVAPPTRPARYEDPSLSQPIDLAIRNVNTSTPPRHSAKSQNFTIRALIDEN